MVGATLTRRVADWRLGDPGQLTLKLGSLGNALASAAVRWDSVHYLGIAEHGYNTPPNTPFFPLYPLMLRAVASLTSSYVVAGVLVSASAFAASMVLLHQLVDDQQGQRAADATVLLVAFSPLSVFLTAVYTESLFLALSLGAFQLARRGRFWLAGAAATGAALTHVEGVLLIAPLAMIYASHRPAPGRLRLSARRGSRVTSSAAPLTLPLVGVAGFFVYVHSRGYGWLAPFSGQRFYARQFTGPGVGILQGVGAGVSGAARMVGAIAADPAGGLGSDQQAFLNVVSLAVLGICISTLCVAWRRLPAADCLYSALCLLTCVSSPAHGGPLMSLDRFALVMFPLWVAAAGWLDERRVLCPALACSATLMVVFAFEFARWTFIG